MISRYNVVYNSPVTLYLEADLNPDFERKRRFLFWGLNQIPMFYFLLKSSVFGREKYFSTYAFEIRSLPLFFVLCFFALFWFFFFFVNRILSTLSLLMDLRYHRPVTDIEISGAIENLCLGKQLLRCKRVLHDREKIIA